MGDEREQAGWETFEHTADVGLRVRADSLENLFLNAARGFVEMLFGNANVRAERTVRVRAEGGEPEDLLVAWLEEVLFACEVDGLVPARIEMVQFGGGRLDAALYGEDFDPGRHEWLTRVKAVTYHDLSIQQADPGYTVDIVFDV
jgi:SHS2 domain-containing protein